MAREELLAAVRAALFAEYASADDAQRVYDAFKVNLERYDNNDAETD